MTISSTVNRLAYTGNGSTTAFSVSFKFIDPEDLVLYVDDAIQVLDTDYTVSGGAGATGTVTFATAPDNAARITILRDPAVLQETDYSENDNFPAETHERALDRLTMIAQRNRDLLERSLTLADSAPAGVSTALPAPSANEVIAWNADGDALENKTVASISTSIIGASITRDVFSGTGSQTAFTLSVDPQVDNNLTVFIGGIFQDQTQWTLSGTTLTFDSAPPSGTDNIVCFQQESVNYPVTSVASGTITTAMLANSAVTPTKSTGLLVAANNLSDVPDDATARGNIGAAGSGAVGSSGLTMATARLLGRTTASSGAVEEITVGSGLSLSAGALTVSQQGYPAVAWVKFDGTRNVTDTGASTNGQPVKIYASGNVASVTKNATGDFTVNFTSALADEHYCVSAFFRTTAAANLLMSRSRIAAPTAAAFRMDIYNTGIAATDCEEVYVSFIR